MKDRLLLSAMVVFFGVVCFALLRSFFVERQITYIDYLVMISSAMIAVRSGILFWRNDDAE